MQLQPLDCNSVAEEGMGGRWVFFSQGDSGLVSSEILGLMILRLFSPDAFFCRWQDGNRVRQYLSEVIPNIRRQLFCYQE